MKYLILFTLSFSTLTFSSEKERACEMAFSADFYNRAVNSFPHSADSLLDEYEDDDDSNEVLMTFAKKEYEEYIKCLKDPKRIEECDTYAGSITKKRHQLHEGFYKGNLPTELCKFEDFNEDIVDHIEYKIRLLNKCKKSKDHLAFIAEEFDLSSKHLKTFKELRIEINDIYDIKQNNKLCDVTPLVYSLNVDSKMSAQASCEKMIPRVNLIIKLKQKCSKER